MLDKRKFSKAVKDKYSFENETFKRVAKNNPKDKIEVEIGDAKQPDFKPQFKLMRWDNEVNFSMRAEEHPQATVETEGEKIKYVTPDYEVHQYDKPEASEDGGFEFEWFLPKKPESNVLTATIQTKGLDFFYQPALTSEEIAEGSFRPEKVVGSYAVYHKTKGGLNDANGKDYKVGKAFHIYRPEAVDAQGNKTWCELNVDVDGGLLQVTVPQEFLDSAVYPVVVDPTFGYTSVGASSNLNFRNRIRGTFANPGQSGSVTSISVYVNFQSVHITAMKGALYKTSDSSLVTPQSDELTGFSTIDGWYNFTFSSSASVNSEDYYIAAWANEPASANTLMHYDVDGSSIHLNVGTTYGDWPDPISVTNSVNKPSIYATYTPSGTYPVLESVTDTDIASSLTSHVVNMPPTVNAGDRLIALVHYRNAGTWNTVPTGWSNLAEQAGGGSVGELAIFEKIADGTEDGTTATWITGTGTTAAWQVIRISGAHASTASEVTTTSGDSSSANPPSETASWGAENNLWLAVAGHSAASTSAFSAAPAGFFGFAQNGASSGGSACSIAHGYDKNPVATYDPGTFTTSGSNRWWAAATIAVRPAAAGGGTAIKTVNDLAIASVKTVNGLAIASVKTKNGLA